MSSRTLTFIALLASIVLFVPVAHAATVSFSEPKATAAGSFAIEVTLNADAHAVNVVEGAIAIPTGLAIDSVTTAGSGFSLWPQTPQFVRADRSIEFSGGVPGGIPAQTSARLFTIFAHATEPGTFTLDASKVNAYENDGKGTKDTLTSKSLALKATVAGTAIAQRQVSGGVTSPLIAEIGSDSSLFDGKYFVSFYGGDAGSGVDHYLVQEGWYRKAVPASRYYVLQDQGRTVAVTVEAVDASGHSTKTTIPAAHPFAFVIPLLGVLAVLVAGFFLTRARLARRKKA